MYNYYYPYLWHRRGGMVMYPLDVVTGATGGWATRKVSSSYAGSCLRIRRSSDNSEQDIGFVGAELDTASLLTFVGANNGFIVTWYDQSGNGRNIVQPTATNQPQLVSSGSVITTLGGQPSIDFDGVDNFMFSGVLISAFLTTSAGTVACIFRADVINTANGTAYDNDTVWCNDDEQVGIALHSTGPKVQAMNQDTGALDVSEITIAEDTNYVHVWQHGSSQVRSFLNNNTGQDAKSTGNTTALNTSLTIGKNYNETAYFDGNMVQLICYNTELSTTDIDSLGAAMAFHYTGLTWT